LTGSARLQPSCCHSVLLYKCSIAIVTRRRCRDRVDRTESGKCSDNSRDKGRYRSGQTGRCDLLSLMRSTDKRVHRSRRVRGEGEVSRASNWSVAIDSCLSASFASDHYLSCENSHAWFHSPPRCPISIRLSTRAISVASHTYPLFSILAVRGEGEVSRASNWSVAIDSCLSASFASDHYLRYRSGQTGRCDLLSLMRSTDKRVHRSRRQFLVMSRLVLARQVMIRRKRRA
jgi:hypothetical protein